MHIVDNKFDSMIACYLQDDVIRAFPIVAFQFASNRVLDHTAAVPVCIGLKVDQENRNHVAVFNIGNGAWWMWDGVGGEGSEELGEELKCRKIATDADRAARSTERDEADEGCWVDEGSVAVAD